MRGNKDSHVAAHQHSSTTTAVFSFTCRCRQRLENQHSLSDELDFVESESLLTSKRQTQVVNKITSAHMVLQYVYRCDT